MNHLLEFCLGGVNACYIPEGGAGTIFRVQFRAAPAEAEDTLRLLSGRATSEVKQTEQEEERERLEQ
jgi:hypothetical protein